MPQFSPLWYVNLIAWTLTIISFVVWYSQTISFPAILNLIFSRALLTQDNLLTKDNK